MFYCEPLDEILNKTTELETKGIKNKDALHISCALYSKYQYFITTDYKLLKKQIDGINIVNPIKFIEEMEE
jgi:predicted nucleic acid-binding protein